MRQANHTDYSDYVIFSHVDKFKEGEYKFKKDAFKAASEELGMRTDQIAGRYYDLKDTKTTADFDNYTREDKENFYPGDGVPKQFNKQGGNERNVSEGGYEKGVRPWNKISAEDPDADNFQKLKEKHEKSEKIILTKNEDNSETVHLSNIKQAVKSLTKDTPVAFRKQLIQDLLNGL